MDGLKVVTPETKAKGRLEAALYYLDRAADCYRDLDDIEMAGKIRQAADSLR